MTVKTDSALEFYKQGKYKEAIDVFSTVLEHDEGNAEVYNNMGLCYAKLNDFEQAEKAYIKSIGKDIKTCEQSYNGFQEVMKKLVVIMGQNISLGENTCHLLKRLLDFLRNMNH